METNKGKLFIKKTKKGDFVAEIVKDGEQKKIPVKTKFKDDKWNGQKVSFEMEKGDVVKIVSESDEVIYEKYEKAVTMKTTSSLVPQEITPEREKLPDSFDLGRTRLPKDVRELSIKSEEVDNFSWKLNQATRYDNETETKSKFKFFYKARKKEDVPSSYEIHANFKKVNLQDILERQKIHVHALCVEHQSLRFFPDWRLIIGLGNESVYETSLTLHHVYGIPYIPASAIKGVTRNYVISEKFRNEEAEALMDEAFCDIFGCSEKSFYNKAQEGRVIFFDAFPTQLDNNSIQPDVMNVHYPDYYGKNQPPTDTQNPNPIFFLTVQNTSFQFIFGVKNSQENEKKLNAKELLEQITAYLKNALEQRGIGAKTAVGYGYLKNKAVRRLG